MTVICTFPSADSASSCTSVGDDDENDVGDVGDGDDVVSGPTAAIPMFDDQPTVIFVIGSSCVVLPRPRHRNLGRKLESK